MRIAALYDVHGNLPALEAVLADVERADVDLIVSGGDVVWGPLPAECLDLLSGFGDRVRYVLGNADRDVLDAVGQESEWCLARLSGEQRAFVASWSSTVVAGDVLFCHGSPRSDREALTRVSPDERIAEAVAGVDQPVVVCGHTHAQFDRRAGSVRVVNAGSVGLPYEGDAAAFWALVGPDVELRRTAYDTSSAVARLVASGFPDAAARLEASLTQPADPDEVARLFENRGRGGA